MTYCALVSVRLLPGGQPQSIQILNSCIHRGDFQVHVGGEQSTFIGRANYRRCIFGRFVTIVFKDDTLDHPVRKATGTSIMSDVDSKIWLVLFPGAISGIICCPMELVVIQQQRFGLSVLQTPQRIISEFGISTMMRGVRRCNVSGRFSTSWQGVCGLITSDANNISLHFFYEYPKPNR